MARHKKERPRRRHRAKNKAWKDGRGPELVRLGALLIQLGIVVSDHLP